ncbi:riboflavin kinase [Neocallimastix californiae]|uniref:Riboflavin kinase n=1 Tax=Neocallimastix californiae TaxID=1754190 RepID=A0A1Y2ELF0_9FUNG|nr:riboflavin kinase [Neocallimastix californiae]|eukprot:ORY72373.1 riboflavin kinase [Neocallimastix californiae]
MSEERKLIVGPEKVEPPYPIYLKGIITRGFGRGSRELGVPTANLPQDVADSASSVLETGVYYGWARACHNDNVYPMVMSYGWNPYYKNEKRSAEVHLINTFPEDFYGDELRVIVLSYIRPELNYSSLGNFILFYFFL